MIFKIHHNSIIIIVIIALIAVRISSIVITAVTDLFGLISGNGLVSALDVRSLKSGGGGYGLLSGDLNFNWLIGGVRSPEMYSF